MNDDDTYDAELSPAEGAQVAKLSLAELALIDAELLSQVADDWRKVARVVGMAMLSMPDRPGGVPDVFFAKRVGQLVESGQDRTYDTNMKIEPVALKVTGVVGLEAAREMVNADLVDVGYAVVEGD